MQRHSLHCLIPPYILDALSKAEDPAVRKLAVDAIEASATARAVRATLAARPLVAFLALRREGLRVPIWVLGCSTGCRR